MDEWRDPSAYRFVHFYAKLLIALGIMVWILVPGILIVVPLFGVYGRTAMNASAPSHWPESPRERAVPGLHVDSYRARSLALGHARQDWSDHRGTR